MVRTIDRGSCFFAVQQGIVTPSPDPCFYSIRNWQSMIYRGLLWTPTARPTAGIARTMFQSLGRMSSQSHVCSCHSLDVHPSYHSYQVANLQDVCRRQDFSFEALRQDPTWIYLNRCVSIFKQVFRYRFPSKIGPRNMVNMASFCWKFWRPVQWFYRGQHGHDQSLGREWCHGVQSLGR